MGITMSQFYRCLCFIMPNTTATTAFNGLVILYLFLFSGYIVAKDAVRVSRLGDRRENDDGAVI
jgi:hypothetical protein